MKNYFLFFSLLLMQYSSCPFVDAQQIFVSCQQDTVRLAERSIELQQIVKADQDDRTDWQNKTPDQIMEVLKRDETRRKRVGEIFGEGCFSKTSDYAAAALVFQHGNTPDHFFQTFIWSKRGVELGDVKQGRMMALGIDRYLINIGHKQLFGGQASRPGFTEETCWCLSQVERSFSDERRKKEIGRTLSDAFEWIKELNKGKNCPNTECSGVLKSSSQGIVPGFW